MTKPYYRGIIARQENKGIETNPFTHPKANKASDEWLEGWMETDNRITLAEWWNSPEGLRLMYGDE